MNLKELALNPEEASYTECAKRNHAIEFFSDLTHDQEISQECWNDLIDIGEQIYFTTFTDDSGYIPGGMNLSVLDKYSSQIRRKVLNYVHRKGNYIVQNHIQDYLEQAA